METIFPHFGTFKIQKVFSLPIRDGNSGSILFQVNRQQVFSLPIRDGNDYCEIAKQRIETFLAYL